MGVSSQKLAGTAISVRNYLAEDDRSYAREYYSTGDGDFRVIGRGAAWLGIENSITSAQFDDLFAGRWEGEQLAQSSYRKIDTPDGPMTIEARTPMIDTVYTWDKSFSVAFIAADDELRPKMAAAALRGAEAGFGAMQDHARVARVPIGTDWANNTSQGSKTERQTADLICTPVLQFTARPTPESVVRGVSDIHVHVHAPIFTLCRGQNGRWYTADEYGLKNRDNAELRDAACQLTTALELERQGLRLEYSDFDDSRRGIVRWKVAGISQEACDHYSTNHARSIEIAKAFEARWGRPMTNVELSEVLRVTRGAKSASDKVQDTAPIWEQWERDCERHGIDLPSLVAQRAKVYPDEPYVWQELTRRLYSPQGLCRDDAVFSEESIRSSVYRCAIGLGMSVDDCHRYESELRKHLVRKRSANDPRHALWTTPVVEQYEADIAASLAARTPTPSISATGISMLGVEADLDLSDVRLDSEQVALVRAVTADAKLTVIEGKAGTGKTYAVAEAVRQIRSYDPDARIVVACTSAATAERTGRKLHADMAGSVESLDHRLGKNGRLSSRDVVVVDEAFMVDTFRMHKLLHRVGDAKMVLISDPEQLAAIGASGWYHDAVERLPIQRLNNVYRTKDPYDLRDFDHVRAGRAAAAVQSLDKRGRVHISADRSHKIADVLYDYRGLRRDGVPASDVKLIVDTSNADLDVANRFVQADRVSRGEVATEGLRVRDNEQGREWELRQGDDVIFLRAAKTPGQPPIRNGSTGTIKMVNPDTGRVVLRMDSGRTATVDLAAHAEKQPIGLAYAVHAAKFQGGEVSRVLYLPGSTTTKRSGYSAMTRCQDRVDVYVDRETHGDDPLKRLASDLARPGDKRSARSHQHEQAQAQERPEARVSNAEPERPRPWVPRSEAMAENIADQATHCPIRVDSCEVDHTPQRDVLQDNEVAMNQQRHDAAAELNRRWQLSQQERAAQRALEPELGLEIGL